MSIRRPSAIRVRANELADATPPLTFEQAKPLVPIFTGYEAINADDDGQTL
jgi:hypothetical protein